MLVFKIIIIKLRSIFSKLVTQEIKTFMMLKKLKIKFY